MTGTSVKLPTGSETILEIIRILSQGRKLRMLGQDLEWFWNMNLKMQMKATQKILDSLSLALRETQEGRERLRGVSQDCFIKGLRRFECPRTTQQTKKKIIISRENEKLYKEINYSILLL